MLMYVSDFFIDSYLNISDWFKYDLLKQPLPDMPSLDLNLHLTLHKSKGKGYWATCDKYPGFIASGKTFEELRAAVFDSILLYFNVPRSLARRLPDKLQLTLSDGTRIQPRQPLLKPITIEVAISG